MTNVAVLGFGTMGQAVTAGLVDSGALPADAVVVVNRSDVSARARELGVTVAASAAEAAQGARTVLVAVKPRDVDALLVDLTSAGALEHRPLVVSIAAGVSLAHLVRLLPEGTPVVRAMPNTACAIRVGTTVLAAGPEAPASALAGARELFEPLGTVMALDERHFDAVTAVSGSGPAFVYVVLDAIAEGGVQCGLPRDVALELAARMALGASTMVLESGRHPAALKDDVTTPAGCTIAGLLALEDGRIRSVLARAVEQTTQVARGLGE